MKAKRQFLLALSTSLLLLFACNKDKTVQEITNPFDTLNVAHSLKGWELYSWPDGDTWYFSILIGTNRLKTFEEVTAGNTSDIHLITVSGLDSLKAVLARFPENEYITWIGQGWLQSIWGSNYGNLQLPPVSMTTEITQYCVDKKLNLQVTD